MIAEVVTKTSIGTVFFGTLCNFCQDSLSHSAVIKENGH